MIPALYEKLRSGDVLLMINDGAGFSPKHANERTKQEIGNLYKGLARISEEMLKRGIFVIYQTGNPFLRDSGCTPDMAMSQWWYLGNEPPRTYYTRRESLARRHMYHESLLALQDRFENFAVLDLFDLFCPSGLCKFYNPEGIFLYRDGGSHPSVEASALAQPLLLKTVDKLIMKAVH